MSGLLKYTQRTIAPYLRSTSSKPLDWRKWSSTDHPVHVHPVGTSHLQRLLVLGISCGRL